MSDANIYTISKVLATRPDKALTEIKGILGDTFSYNNLRYVKNHLIQKGALAGV
ncbi:MAG: hypothetical protein PSX81_15425 [bacterium]|nr:hypothetical protein [bacterium]